MQKQNHAGAAGIPPPRRTRVNIWRDGVGRGGSRAAPGPGPAMNASDYAKGTRMAFAGAESSPRGERGGGLQVRGSGDGPLSPVDVQHRHKFGTRFDAGQMGR